MTVRWLFAAALAIGVVTTAPQAEESPQALQWRLIQESFRPASEDELERYLEIREALQPFYEQHQLDLTQWALREAGTIPAWGSLLRVSVMRKKLDEQLGEKGLDFETYMRLTYLVYGRWLRASRDAPSPEAKLVRELSELAVGIKRHLANNPPEAKKDRERLEQRLESVRNQIAFVEPFAYETQEEREAILKRLDPAAVSWLERNRDRVEKCDFGVFDTAPPPRSDERPAPAPASS